MEPNKSHNIRINRPGSSSRMGFNSMNAHRPTTPTTAREIPLTDNDVEMPLSEPTPVVSNHAPKKKNHKVGMIIIFIVAAIAILGIGIVAGIFVDREFLNKAVDNTASVEQTPTVAPTDTATITNETDITDAATLEDLTKKVKVLFSDWDTDIAGGIDISTPSGRGEVNYATAGKIVDGLTDDEKFGTALAYTYIANGHYKNDIETNTHNAIPAAEVESTYAELFGTVPTHRNATGNWCTGEFTYDAATGSYTTTGPACGGTLESADVFYLSDFTTDGTKAYVYVSAGSTEFAAEPNADGNYPMNVYDDVSNHSNTRQLLETVADYSGFSGIDSTNYNNFASYRFVFTQDANGNYYFETVEKI